MKKFKVILAISILSLSTYVGIETYNYMTMTESERLILQNIEALTQEESYPLGTCIMPISSQDGVQIMPCDSRTTNDRLYNCPRTSIKADWRTTARCVEN